jgi:hypothetical protein
MSKSRTIVYPCQMSSQRLHVRHEDSSLWMQADDAARLFGKRRAQFEKTLKYLQLNREIDEVADVMRVGSDSATIGLWLNHRAVISVGYHLNFGRVPAFRDWCSKTLEALHVGQ